MAPIRGHIGRSNEALTGILNNICTVYAEEGSINAQCSQADCSEPTPPCPLLRISENETVFTLMPSCRVLQRPVPGESEQRGYHTPFSYE